MELMKMPSFRRVGDGLRFLPKVVTMGIAAVAAVMPAVADTYVLDSALTGRDDIDWTVASSYTGTHTRDPEAGDTVEIPAGMTAKITAGSANWTLINTLARIVPRSGAVFEVAVPGTHEGRAVLSVPVTEYGLPDASNSGTLRKTGGGALELASYGKVKDGTVICDYDLDVAVEGGDLHLYRSGTSATEVYAFFNMTVAEGAKLHICDVGYTRCANLNGAGDVTLDNGAAQQRLYIYGAGTSSFSGWMTGKIRLDITAGRHDITCPSNTIDTICLSGSAVCGFTRLGADNSVPSSLGTGNFNYGASSGIIYLGDYVETSSKTFWLHNDTFIDAGAHGGLTLSGKLDSGGNASNLRIFTLSGSNENACVISGTFPGRTTDQKNVFYLRKTGTGTWRMAHNGTRGSLGVIDVEEGTLQFDTIAEKGQPCSLGYATNLFEKKVLPYESGVPVDYAMVLGGADTEGTLEYTGTAPGICSTRPIAIRSKGRFKTTDVGYTLRDVYALGAGERTLTLESSADTGWRCIAAKLSDGPDGGRLSVVKEGNGIWQLGGTNSFTGSAFARAGTLLINNPSRKYRFYRFIVTENAYSCDRYDTANSTGQGATASAAEKGYVQIMHLALYDADGNNLVYNFKQKTPITQFAFEGGDARVMEPREVAIGQSGTYGGFTDASQLLQNLFNTSGYPATGRLAASDGGIRKNAPATWMPIVVRLPDDAPAAVRLDFQCGRNREGVGSYNGRNMTAFRLDASADGVNWDEGIAQNDAVDVPETLGHWDSDGTTTSVSAVRKDKGMVLSGSETDRPKADCYAFAAIGAAGGGVVRVEGLPYEIAGLVVDASAPAGTVSNVVFAAVGTLDVRNAEAVMGVPLELPGDYSQLAGVENIAGWSLNLNGEPCRSRKIAVRDGRLRLNPKGLGISIR